MVNLTLTAQMPVPNRRKPARGIDAAEPLLQNREGNARAQNWDRCVPTSQAQGEVDHETSIKPRVLCILGQRARGCARAGPQRNRARRRARTAGDVFVLSYDAGAGYPFRVAGTRVCALLGCD